MVARALRCLALALLLTGGCDSGTGSTDGNISGLADVGRADLPAPDLPDAAALPDTLADAPATTDAALPADTALSADNTAPPDAGKPLSRGLQWVRTHPMFISGLTVTMGAPTAPAVNDYFNLFNATAVHLWQKGLPTAMDGWRLHGPNPTRFVSWLLDDGTSLDNKQVIGGYAAGLPGRIGYQVGDEPQDLAELKQIEVGVNAARQADPDALVYVNFSYLASGLQQLLTYYGTQMDGDVISYDRYTRSNKSYGTMAIFRDAGLKYGLPYWRYMRSYHDLGQSDDLTESDMRWDAFSGLVYGFTGHTWFLYQINNNQQLMPSLFTAQSSFAATQTPLYAVAGQINQELANLGRCITQLTSTDVRYIPSVFLLQPQGTTTWQAGAGNDPYLSKIAPAPGQLLLDILVGFFKDDAGEVYVMVQNVRHENGDWPVDNDDTGTIRLTFDFSQAGAGVGQTALRSLNKVTGKVESLALTPAAGGPYYDAVLTAGDALLFKYDTGAPFALQP